MKRLKLTKVYGTCVPIPFVLPDGVYIPCEIRVALWGGFILLGLVAFLKVKNSADS